MNWKQRLLDWSAPDIEEFQVLDLLVAQKSVLLVSWKGKHISSVHLPQLKKRYNGSSLGVVLSFPELYESIIVEFNNGFLKRLKVCPLKRIELSQEAADKIIHSFSASRAFKVMPFKPSILFGSFQTGFDNMEVKLPEVISICNQVQIKSSAFEYSGGK